MVKLWVFGCLCTQFYARHVTGISKSVSSLPIVIWTRKGSLIYFAHSKLVTMYHSVVSINLQHIFLNSEYIGNSIYIYIIYIYMLFDNFSQL